MTGGSFEGLGGIKIFTRAWRPAASRTASWSSRTDSTRTVVSTCGSPSSWWPGGSLSTRWIIAAAGKSDGERFFVQEVQRLHVDDLTTFMTR